MSERETKCKGCGAPIFWGMTWNGKAIPVDVKQVQVLVKAVGGSEPPVFESTYAYTAHFATCPKASEFRRKK